MSYPLRLVPELEQRARQRAAEVGISFNALIAVALDAYLRGGATVAPEAVVVRKRGRPAKRSAVVQPQSGEQRPDWRFFHPDPDFWPYVDPEFAHRWEGVDQDDPVAAVVLEAEYWATRERPSRS